MTKKRLFWLVAAAAALNSLSYCTVTALFYLNGTARQSWNVSIFFEGDISIMFLVISVLIPFVGGWLLVALTGARLRLAALIGFLSFAIEILTLNAGVTAAFVAPGFVSHGVLPGSAGTLVKDGLMLLAILLVISVTFGAPGALVSWLGGLSGRLHVRCAGAVRRDNDRIGSVFE